MPRETVSEEKEICFKGECENCDSFWMISWMVNKIIFFQKMIVIQQEIRNHVREKSHRVTTIKKQRDIYEMVFDESSELLINCGSDGCTKIHICSYCGFCKIEHCFCGKPPPDHKGFEEARKFGMEGVKRYVKELKQRKCVGCPSTKAIPCKICKACLCPECMKKHNQHLEVSL